MNSLMRLTPGNPLGAAKLWERGFAALVLVASTGAFLNLSGDFTDQQLDAGQGLWFMKVFWAAAYVVTACLILKQCRIAITSLLRQYWLIALVVLSFVSAVWSGAPALTLRKAVALAATTLFGAYFATRYEPGEQLRLLVSACTVVMTFSIAFSILGIGHAVNTPDAGWIGVFVHRNAFGRMMVFSAGAFLAFAYTDRTHKNSGYMRTAIAFLLILMSTSRGALVYGCALLVAFLYFVRLRQTTRAPKVLKQTLFAAVLLAAVGCVVLKYFDAITAAMGRDANMTGRIPMWIYSAVFALQHPWLGYGFNAFWRGAEGPSAGIWQLLSWAAPHAHNGLLNLWLDLGFVGVGIFLCGFAVTVVRSFRFLRRCEESAAALWPCTFLAFFVVSNLTESSMVDVNTIFWIAYVSVFINVSRSMPVRNAPFSTRVRRLGIPLLLSAQPPASLSSHAS